MNFHNAVSITEFLSSAVSMLRNARDLAKESGNAELKRVINELFDAFSEMKERMLAMDDEITNLKSQLAKKAAITGPHTPFGYFYKNDDADHPLCPKCYQEKGHEFMLTVEHFNGGVNRVCQCGWSAEELPAEAVGQMRVGRMGGRRR
jgi:uncharacterized small protein (DUF1192 family)